MALLVALTLLSSDAPPEEARVREAAQAAVNVVRSQSENVEVDVENLVRQLEARLNVAVGNGSTLVDDSSDHIPWLADRRADIEWSFTRRYQRFLNEIKGWALPTLQRYNSLTDRVLELMEDPRRSGHWDRRGMVVGEVQSGKTSNYIELICKAADAGYKFIVVLTGTTNSLRAQTQLRFDEGFLGWDTRLNLALDSTNKRVGVGTLFGEPLLRAIPSTNAEETGDFNLKVANQFNVRLGGDPVIMVVKKYGSVLQHLTRWAKSLHQADGAEEIADMPLLVIDDEADFASVNTRPVPTNGDEDPTAINARIRELLNAFAQSVYIGYTATPFANIFIYPDQEGHRYGEDLFPKDFLINLPVPSNHVGPTKVFGLPANSEDDEPVPALPLVRIVQDHRDHIPNVHRSNLKIEELPESLDQAIMSFIVVCATRAARGQVGVHNSMLVHVTRFVDVQNQVAELVDFKLRELQDRIRYGDGASPQKIRDQLRELWHEDFLPTTRQATILYPELMTHDIDVTWDDVESKLVESSQKIQIKVINGSAKDALDYWDHPAGVSAIAIGGDKLSRGLTLEGLSVSYYLRASRMYDTLLQMGRWFGYRPGYVDLCRLYTTDELRDFYTHITMATDELKQEFEVMADRGLTPSEFGLRVRSHSAGLVVTAANKMRNGTRMTLSYSADISEIIAFDRDASVNLKNYETYSSFIEALKSPNLMTESGNRLWTDVQATSVTDLLAGINVHPASRKARGNYLANYIRNQNLLGGLTEWTVALISNKVGDATQTIGGHEIRPVQRTQHPENSQDRLEVYRIRRLVNPDDEFLDLSETQRVSALEKTKEQYHRDPQGSRYQTIPASPSGPHIRRARDHTKGLLLIYPLRETDEKGIPFVGFAVSFPAASNDSPVPYIVNTVYGQQEMDI